MDRGIYAAATAVDTIGRMQEVFAHNLANLNTTAFKERIGYLHEDPHQAVSGMQSPTLGFAQIFEQGDIYRTGDKLHFAIDGPGFFAVDGGSLGTLYTRDGRLALSSNGDLMTYDGHRLLGGEGIMPPGQAGVTDLTIEGDGSILRNGSKVAQIVLVDFDDPTALEQAGSGVYTKPKNAVEKPFLGQVRQGYLERSNVSAVGEMVQMITFSRIYDSANRVIRALHDASARQIRNR